MMAVAAAATLASLPLLLLAALLLIPTAHGAKPALVRWPRLQSRLTYRFVLGEHCRTGPPHHILIHNFSTTLDRHGMLHADSVFELLKDAQSMSLSRVKIHRCRDAISSNTCEYFATWTYPGRIVCTSLEDTSNPCIGALRTIEPPFHCPLRQGVYKMTNGTIDLSLVERWAQIDLAGSIWIVEITTYDQAREPYTCIRGGVKVTRTRSKD